MKSGGLSPKRVYDLHCSSCLAQFSLSGPVRALICLNGLDLIWSFHPQLLYRAQELHRSPALGLQSLPEPHCRNISLQPNICPSLPDRPSHLCLLGGPWTCGAICLPLPLTEVPRWTLDVVHDLTLSGMARMGLISSILPCSPTRCCRTVSWSVSSLLALGSPSASSSSLLIRQPCSGCYLTVSQLVFG